MFSDVYPGYLFQVGNNVSLTLEFDEIEEMRKVFKELGEGGTIEMDLQETFWYPSLYGSVIDKFGISWQITMEANALDNSQGS